MVRLNRVWWCILCTSSFLRRKLCICFLPGEVITPPIPWTTSPQGDVALRLGVFTKAVKIRIHTPEWMTWRDEVRKEGYPQNFYSLSHSLFHCVKKVSKKLFSDSAFSLWLLKKETIGRRKLKIYSAYSYSCLIYPIDFKICRYSSSVIVMHWQTSREYITWCNKCYMSFYYRSCFTPKKNPQKGCA
jgi:hypothetical protein